MESRAHISATRTAGRRPLRAWLAGAVLVGALGYLGFALDSGEALTRLRNSLVAVTGTPADFDWAPPGGPPGFRLESAPAPDEFRRAAGGLGGPGTDDVVLAVAMVEHLRARPKRRGPIKASTLEAYREIRATGRGYCADYTQVFNGLAYAADLPVREWGMSFGAFAGVGHAFSEVYSRELGKWVFVDPINGFIARDRDAGVPLSVVEFRARLAADAATIEVLPVGDAFLFDSEQAVFDYYRQGLEEFYLWFGNDVFSYDAHPAVQFAGRFGRPVEQLAAILLGIHPRMHILPTADNGPAIQALQRFKYWIGAALLLAIAAAVVLLGELRVRRPPRRAVSLDAAAPVAHD